LDVEKIRRLAAQGKYEFSKHAERERELDMIYVWELEDALCAVKADPEELLLITVYDPSERPDKWTENYRKRR